MDTARCGKCKVVRPVTQFAKNKNRRNGLQSTCTPCRRKYNSSTSAKRLARDRKLRFHYGITLEHYEEMYEAQGGLCASCGRHERSLANTGDAIKALSVDHDHSTNKVRELLCHNCNTGLGHLPTAELLLAAAEYLRRNETAVTTTGGATSA